MTRLFKASSAAVVSLSLVLAACTVTPEPLTDEERAARVAEDRAWIQAHSQLPDKGVNLYDAMALALRFNLRHRERILDTAIASGMAKVDSFDMLPSLAASAGWRHRSNDNASVSKDLTTGTVDQSPSTSVERTRATADLRLTWNVLDFGVSYLQARQNADRVLIAREKRRKAVQMIVRDVQSAWLRAVVAERLEADMAPLIARIEEALDDARTVESQRLMEPMEALDAQKQLLDLLRRLQTLRQQVAGAKVELARLLSIPPGTDFAVSLPPDLNAEPLLKESLAGLVDRALLDRPELREADYQSRISAEETNKAILRLLPGIDLNLGGNFDSNTYLVNTTWANAGMFLAWNLMNLITGPSRIALAEQQEEATTLRRLALHMAVTAQVNVAWTRLHLAREVLDLENRIADVDERIYGHTLAGAESSTQTDIELIRRDAARLASRVRRDMAYVAMEEALSELRVSVGDDPLAAVDTSATLEDLSVRLMAWHRNRYAPPRPRPTRDPVVPAGPTRPATSPPPATLSPPESGSPGARLSVPETIPDSDGDAAVVPWTIRESRRPGGPAPSSASGASPASAPAQVPWVIERSDERAPAVVDWSIETGPGGSGGPQ